MHLCFYVKTVLSTAVILFYVYYNQLISINQVFFLVSKGLLAVTAIIIDTNNLKYLSYLTSEHVFGGHPDRAMMLKKLEMPLYR